MAALVWLAGLVGFGQELAAWLNRPPYRVELARVNALFNENREEWRRQRVALYCRTGKYGL
jgi:hypothetical protein